MRNILYKYLIICIISALAACSDSEDKSVLQAGFDSDVIEVTAGEIVNYVDKSEGNPSRWDWYFDGGTPSRSQLFSPEITYQLPGTYSVRLVVGRNNDSIAIEKTGYVNVKYPSVVKADFVISAEVATNEDEVSFTDKSTGLPTSWLWEFIPQIGDIITSKEGNPKLALPPGVYTVKLTVSNPEASDTKSVADILNIIDKYTVSADFKVSNRNTYAGGTISFQDISFGNTTAWEWSFEGGTPAISKEQHPSVQYTTAGRYKVSLIAKNEANSSTTEKKGYIIVIPGKDLVAYYPFNGNEKDAGPNLLHPEIISNGTATINFDNESREPGLMAATFSGSENMSKFAILSLPQSNLLDFKSSDFTVSFWVKTDDIKKNRAVFHQGAGPNMRPDKTNRQTWFRFQPAAPFVRFAIEYTGSAGNWGEYQTKSMADGNWHHYVAVHQSGNSYLYIDGKEVANSLNKPLKEIDGYPYFIGCNYRVTDGVINYENFMEGSIDDFIIYHRALDADEAKELYEKY